MKSLSSLSRWPAWRKWAGTSTVSAMVLPGLLLMTFLLCSVLLTGLLFQPAAAWAASGPPYPESEHPYANSMNQTWTYTLDGNPNQISVTFDSRTQVENNYDKIYVNGSMYTGTALAGETLTLDGATLTIKLTSDGSVNRWGFAVTNIVGEWKNPQPSPGATVNYMITKQWSQTFGGAEDDSGVSVQRTTDGGFIMTGSTSSPSVKNSTDLDSDLWLIKTGPDGTKEWDRVFGGTGYDLGTAVQQTSDGGYIITGYTQSYTVAEDGGTPSGNIWVIKTDAQGNKLWDQTLGSAYDDPGGFGVFQTADGGYVVAGYINNPSDSYPQTLLVKLVETDGQVNEVWRASFSQAGTIINSLAQDSDGGYLLVGRSFNSWSSALLIKTDSNGNELWTGSYGPSGANTEGYSVQPLNGGGYIITGDINNGTAGYDVWLTKLDSDGGQEWEQTFSGPGDDYGFDVRQTTDEGFIIAADRGTTDGSADGWLIKTSANGIQEWGKTFGGSEWDSIHSIQEVGDQEYVFTGRTTSYGAGQYDLWLVKVKAEQMPETELARLQFVVPADDSQNMTVTWDGLHEYIAGYDLVKVATAPAITWDGQTADWSEYGQVLAPENQVTLEGAYRDSAIKLDYYDYEDANGNGMIDPGEETLLGSVVDVERAGIGLSTGVDAQEGRIDFSYNPSYFAGSIPSENHVRLNITAIDNPTWGLPVDLYLNQINYSFKDLDNTGAYSYKLKAAVVDSRGWEVRSYIFTNGDQGYSFTYTPAEDTSPPANVNAWVSIPQDRAKTIVLNWYLPSDNDYDHARLYQRLVGENEWQDLATVNILDNPNNSFEVTGLDAAMAYQFKIASVDVNGNASSGTYLLGNSAGSIYQGYMPLPAPVNVSEVSDMVVTLVPAASLDDVSLDLAWTNPSSFDSPAELAGARVYIAKQQGETWDSWQLVSELQAGGEVAMEPGQPVTFTINRETYPYLQGWTYYRIKVTTLISLAGNQYESLGSAAEADLNINPLRFETTEVAGVRAVIPDNEGGVISVYWEDPNNMNLNHVQVSIRKNGDPTWPTGYIYDRYVRVGQQNYWNLDSSGATAYDVKVAAIDADGNQGPGVIIENLVPKSPEDTWPPSQVTNIAVYAPNNGLLQLNWRDPSDLDLAAISVFYGPIGSDPVDWPVVRVAPAADGNNGMQLSGLDYSRAYGLLLVTEDSSGNLGQPKLVDNDGEGYFPNPFAPVYVPGVEGVTVDPDYSAQVPTFNVSWIYPTDIENYLGAYVEVSRLGPDGWEEWQLAGYVDRDVNSLAVSSYGGDLMDSWTTGTGGLSDQGWTPSPTGGESGGGSTGSKSRITVDVPYRFKVHTLVQDIEGYTYLAIGVVNDNQGAGYLLPLPEVDALAAVSTQPVPLSQEQPYAWEDTALDLSWVNPLPGYITGKKIYLALLDDSFGEPLAVLDQAAGEYRIDWTNLTLGLPYKVKIITFIDVPEDPESGMPAIHEESPGLVRDNQAEGYTFVTNEVGNVRVEAPPTGGQITVFWNDPNNPNLNHVRLYIRPSGTAAWGSPADVYQRTGSFTFINLDRTGGTNYDVRVSAVNDATASTTPGRIFSGLSAQDVTPPSPVSTLQVSIPRDGGALVVNWNEPPEPDYAYARVYWREVGNLARPWTAVEPVVVPRGTNTYIITGLQSDPASEQVAAWEVMVETADDLDNTAPGVVNNGVAGEGYLPLPMPVQDVTNLQVFEPSHDLAMPAGSLYLTWGYQTDPNRDSVDIYAAYIGSNQWVKVGSVSAMKTSATVKLDGFMMNGTTVQVKVYVNSRSGHRSDGVINDNGGLGYRVLASAKIEPGPGGWITLSTPVRLLGSHNLIGPGNPWDVLRESDVLIAYKYDPSLQADGTPVGWVQVQHENDNNDNNNLSPLEAVYVRLKTGTKAVFMPSQAQTNPPIRSLLPGWNLVGVTRSDSVYNSLASLSDRQQAGNSAPLNWVAAVSPNVNGLEHSWVLTSNQQVDENTKMLPGYGYWVYLSDSDELIGNSSTPLYAGQLGPIRQVSE